VRSKTENHQYLRDGSLMQKQQFADHGIEQTREQKAFLRMREYRFLKATGNTEIHKYPSDDQAQNQPRAGVGTHKKPSRKSAEQKKEFEFDIMPNSVESPQSPGDDCERQRRLRSVVYSNERHP
jgi:hypothetical protein